jgi:hypothetical protein
MAISAGGTWQVQDWRMGERLAEQAGLHQGEPWTGSARWPSSKCATSRTSAWAWRRRWPPPINNTPENFLMLNATRFPLRDRLATADVRLSVLLDATDSASGCNVPATTGAVGVVHAARRAQLDPAHAQRIIAITDDGDRGLIALRACQAYVRAMCCDKLDRHGLNLAAQGEEMGQGWFA